MDELRGPETGQEHPIRAPRGELTSRQVCDHAGVTYRQLDYWSRSGYLGDEGEGRRGSGIPRRWTPRQAAVVAVLADLVNAGAPIGRLADLARDLEALPHEQWRGELWLDPRTGETSRRPRARTSIWLYLGGYDPGT